VQDFRRAFDRFASWLCETHDFGTFRRA
jgi:hypothetical protein